MCVFFVFCSQDPDNNEQVEELPIGDQQLTLQQRINQSEAATLSQLLNFDAAEIGVSDLLCFFSPVYPVMIVFMC